MIVGYANRFKNVFFRLSCPNPSRQPLNHLIKNTKAEDSLRVENQVKQNPVGRGDDGAEGGTETGDTHLWRGCGSSPCLFYCQQVMGVWPAADPRLSITPGSVLRLWALAI